jgi:hypothetical protein
MVHFCAIIQALTDQTMASPRGEFSSRFGFIMAAAGSAVGLGNIWGFPTQAAGNGGAAFLLVYLVLAFTLAYPALMAELIIGRHAHANAATALRLISPNQGLRRIGTATGVIGFIVASFILSFYAIVAGWMLAHCAAAIAELFRFDGLGAWLTEFSFARNLGFMLLFMALTVGIISEGVQQGIERWSSRLMPMLLVSLILLVVYVFSLEGAMEGLRVYLLPDFERALAPDLIVKALGAAFFSLSLGVGTMLIYGSYISDRENLPVVGGIVTLVDTYCAMIRPRAYGGAVQSKDALRALFLAGEPLDEPTARWISDGLGCLRRIARPLRPAQLAGGDKARPFARADAVAGALGKVVCPADLEPGIERPGDAHQHHPLWPCSRKQARSAGRRGHRSKAAQLQTAAISQGGGQGIVQRLTQLPSLKLGGDQDQGFHRRHSKKRWGATRGSHAVALASPIVDRRPAGDNSGLAGLGFPARGGLSPSHQTLILSWAASRASARL